jgi:hypothetical protein
MIVRICPVCLKTGVSLLGRFGLPLTGHLDCSKCGCRLRSVRHGLRTQLSHWTVWLLLFMGFAASLVWLTVIPFLVAVAAWFAAQLAAPLELDSSHSPSVRRAERLDQ